MSTKNSQVAGPVLEASAGVWKETRFSGKNTVLMKFTDFYGRALGTHEPHELYANVCMLIGGLGARKEKIYCFNIFSKKSLMAIPSTIPDTPKILNSIWRMNGQTKE